ncbi:sigma-70 family RNA polymerase sigma factor [Sphingomonas sp. JC676]|uniref:sigma-70 family RNA polymerase sigma factor n=1 Tax=Sphingomonas sp. JC676 TaxID=2768065 RepID=UPI001657FA08|nr:sigma-70 family RNA polymerase sigma factor [Sphingomonas sp. JC676]MBC9032124.1 sigma-70 family RNA polymerase sigma factor [Sphingomonas sp. JC676]
MATEPVANVQAAPLSDREIKEMLAVAIPQLRAFARGLCGSADLADDFVQETMLKAWSARHKFQPGTNFRAWTFTILRNHYLTQMRRRKFVGEWDELAADRLLAACAGQDKIVELRDMLRALQELPVTQREALILVGAGGLSYEEAAEILDVAVGTVKSRVSRGRIALEGLVGGGLLEQTRRQFAHEGDAVVSIFAYLERLQRRSETFLDRRVHPPVSAAA